jgi:hypothetical protein
MSVYVIEEGETLAPIVYRTFEQAKAYLTAKAAENGWEIVNDYDRPEPDFEEDNVNRYAAGRARPAERPIGKTYIWAQREDAPEITIIIHKLTLKDAAEDDPVGPEGGRRTRRRTAKTIRMKKGEYLREHHHLFRVLRNPTRRALNAELRRQQKELKERGLKG